MEKVLCRLIDTVQCFAQADKSIATACSGSAGNFRIIRDTAITTAVDVVTDMVVLSFPIVLLWGFRVDVSQKSALALFLCLSVVMVIVAIVRISLFRLGDGEVDIVWLAFWQQQESSVAVIVSSLSAFRQLFVAKSVPQLLRKLIRQSVND